MRRIVITTIFLTLTAQVIFSQFSDIGERYNINGIVPPSPTVSALISKNDLNVNEQNGTVNFSIPLESVRGSELEIPISMNYHSSGLKLEEVASWVGLGWSLSASYSISRTKIGDADEVGFIGTTTIPDLGPGVDPLPHYEYFRNLLDIGMQPGTSNNLDSEPDIFHFSIPGYSGEFYFDQQGSIHQLPQQDLDISYTYINEEFEFTIITPSGTKYFFGGDDINGNSTIEKTLSNPICQQDGTIIY